MLLFQKMLLRQKTPLSISCLSTSTCESSDCNGKTNRDINSNGMNNNMN